MQTLLNHPFIALLIFILGLIALGIVLIIIAKDITRTSDKALEEHYKRNKK